MAIGSKLPATLRGEIGPTIDGDFKIVQLLPDAKAVIAIKGLCRLVMQPSGWVIYEFVSREFAHREVALPHFIRKEGEWEEAVDYETGKVLNFDNRGLSLDWTERLYQLHMCSSSYDNEDSMKVQRKTYYRAKGFKLGRLLPGRAKKTRDPVVLPIKFNKKRKQAS